MHIGQGRSQANSRTSFESIKIAREVMDNVKSCMARVSIIHCFTDKYDFESVPREI